jgi:hypothetical protein
MLNKTITIPSPLKHYLQQFQANPPPPPPLIPVISQEDLERQTDRQTERQRENERETYTERQKDRAAEKNEVGKREEKDADPSLFHGQEAAETPGTQFTCFTSKKVQTLTQKLAISGSHSCK